MNKNIAIITIVCLALFGEAILSAETANIDKAIQEVNASFTYQHKPIHPGLVEEFESSIADPGEPTTISVDINAKHGNEYFEDDVSVKGGTVFLNKDDGGYFCYKWLGKLNNDLHVLNVGDNGSGSGVFSDLLFVRFSISEGYYKGEKYKRLLMTIVGTYGLGDKDEGDIKVLTDKVIIGKSQHRKKEVVLRFP